MSDERKNTSIALWAIVALVAVLLAYPLSFGPLFWLGRHEMLPESVGEPLMVVYQPIVWLWIEGPNPISEVINSYLSLWVDHPGLS